MPEVVGSGPRRHRRGRAVGAWDHDSWPPPLSDSGCKTRGDYPYYVPMFSQRVAILLALVLAGLSPSPAAAEFDIDAGRVILRRLQLCADCGSALLVTDVPTGAPIRCPDCGREQPRLAVEYLINQVYQLCRLCQGPLDAHGHQPGDIVECDTCHTRQSLSRDGILPAWAAAGKGYLPGFPPGTARKTLLYSASGADSPLTPYPL
ncbi:MAG: hypothetical protein LIP77_06935, partial [Planctomycetes bacterium]|nr:hypothetical protein [Planctomycetota bacterium]